MSNTPIIIAIDGPAASGKGTLARHIAKELDYAYLDTGTLYRAAALEVLEMDGNPEDETQATSAAQSLTLKLKTAVSPADILQNPKLREDTTGNAAAKIAAIPAVRKKLFAFQKDFAKNPGPSYKGAILDGRDIGTVICPDATAKLFVTADIETRSQRRTKELQSKGLDVIGEAVLRDMRARDAQDAGRQAAPMQAAQDAFTLDTSNMGPDEAFEKAMEFIRSKLS